MTRKRLAELTGTITDPYDLMKAVIEEVRQEIYHVLCFLCRNEGEPEAGGASWYHLHKGADGKVYSKTECKCAALRRYYQEQQNVKNS